jgi:prepilin-type N-terminal cleavage/methylation domain-containing protein
MKNTRGFTLLELLAAISVAAIALTMLASAVRSQGSSAIFQMGSADMQQNVRGALELFRREVRMAGYGMSSVLTTTLPVLEVPAAGAGNLYRVNLRGNFGFVKSRVNAATAAGASTIALQKYQTTPTSICMPGNPAKSFTPGERVSFESALLGVAEIRTITAFDSVNCTVTVTPALTVSYDSGSPVNEIQEISYRLDNTNVLWREDVVMADQIDNMAMQYVLNDGTQVADPVAVMANLRSASITLRSEKPERDGLTPQAELETEVRIRNLALVRTPALDNL